MKDFVNRPKVELEDWEADVIENAINLFEEIANESCSYGPAFQTLGLAADKMVEYLSDFYEKFTENS